MTYKCNHCGEYITFAEDEFECNGSFHPDGEEMLWGHIQLCHPYIFERDQNLETPFMIEENYTSKENTK